MPARDKLANGRLPTERTYAFAIARPASILETGPLSDDLRSALNLAVFLVETADALATAAAGGSWDRLVFNSLEADLRAARANPSAITDLFGELSDVADPSAKFGGTSAHHAAIDDAARVLLAIEDAARVDAEQAGGVWQEGTSWRDLCHHLKPLCDHRRASDLMTAVQGEAMRAAFARRRRVTTDQPASRPAETIAHPELLALVGPLRLKGDEKRVIEAVARSGSVPLDDLAELCDWKPEYAQSWKSLQRRVKTKLAPHRWLIVRENNAAEAIKLPPLANPSGRKRV